MKINELLQLHNQQKIENLKDILCVKTHISTQERLRIVDEIIDASVEYDRGYVKFDTYKKCLTSIFILIEAHTNLEFAVSWDERVAEYDSLCETELLGQIITEFQHSYETCLSILNMKCDDLLANNSVEASVAKVAQSIIENIDVFVGTVSDKLAEVDLKKIIPDDLDLNKLQKFLNKVK